MSSHKGVEFIYLSYPERCICPSVCAPESQTEWDDKRWHEEGEWELCWQADGLSCCLPRSSTSHPITPASSHQLVVRHSLSSNIHSLSLCWSLSPRATSQPFLLVCFVGCMSSVRCNLCWLICCGICVGVKPAEQCPPAQSRITPSVSGAVCIGKAAAWWEAGRSSAVSKDLLGWNPPCKDAWQRFIATKNGTSTDPTVAPPLLVGGRQLLTGHSWLHCFYLLFFLQAQSGVSDFSVHAG